jgi:hypothetical protein
MTDLPDALKGITMHKSPVLSASVLASLLFGTAAAAQVSPEQVWQNWRDMSTSYGQTLTTTGEARTGDTLTVSGVAITSSVDEVTTSATIDRIDFRDRGDGTVEITMSPQIPLTVTSAEAGEAFTLNLALEQTDAVIVASALEADTRYDFTAPTVRLTMTAPPTETDPSDARVVVEVSAMAGTYAVSSTDLSRIATEGTVDSMRMTVNATDPDTANGGTVALTASVNGIAIDGNSAILSSEQMEDLAAALAAGFSTDTSLTYAGADYRVDFTDSSGTSQSTGTFGPGKLAVVLDQDRMAYGGTASTAEIKVSGATIPFPELVISYAEAAFDFVMPVSKSEIPQDFRALTRIVDLAVSDEVWAMFDPGALLPRDPATLVIDLDGKARWLMDLFSPEAAEMETVPGELSALTINDVTLRAVGASVAGKGAFTFDNTDLTTFDGMPAPTGVLDVTIVGATALLDRLSQSGLLPPDQVMGAKMMMGLFARPGPGEDTLTTQVEFKDKGLFVNGQQLQ